MTVQQDTLGALCGYAHLAIETPGEQDNYEFSVVGDARDKAKAIIEAHENYVAALESGQIQTTLGQRPPTPGAAWRGAPNMPQDPAANPSAALQTDPVVTPVASQPAQSVQGDPYASQNWQQPVAQPYQPSQDTSTQGDNDDNSKYTIPRLRASSVIYLNCL